MYTIVTAYFDIGRDRWRRYRRLKDFYFHNAERTLSLDDNMVIYIESQYLDFVKKHRQKYPEKTRIIPLRVEDLDYYKYKDQIQQIMEDPNFQQGLKHPLCPEVIEPLYDIVVWSKINLVVKAIKENFFQTSHFVWLDFGVHKHMLLDNMLNKPLLEHVPDPIKLLCRSYPHPNDLFINKFYKSHINRLVAAMISGKSESFQILDAYLDKEIQKCLKKKVVDSDQSLLTVIFLKHPELFQLYYGDHGQLITNYYQTKENLRFVIKMAVACKILGNQKAYLEIMNSMLPPQAKK